MGTTVVLCSLIGGKCHRHATSSLIFPLFHGASVFYSNIYRPELPGGQLVVFTFARASRAASASAAIAL